MCDAVGKKLASKFDDYHILTLACAIEDIFFECYNTTDLDTKSFEELKGIVKNLNH